MALALACYFTLWWLMQPLGNHGLWLALIGFLVARGIGQGIAYFRLLPRSFATGQPLKPQLEQSY